MDGTLLAASGAIQGPVSPRRSPDHQVAGLIVANDADAPLDFFGRGYSDAPTDTKYDSRLYLTQILIVLASSDIPWTGASAFHLAGYSLGGAVAASFARYYPRMVRSLTLICSGGLVRSTHLGWQSKLLYSENFLPERLVRFLVGLRLRPQSRLAKTLEADDGRVSETEPETSGGFDDTILSRSRPGIRVADVVSWQLAHHPGFIYSYLSTIRNAPIYEQGDRDWAVLGELLSMRRGGGKTDNPGLERGRVCAILADDDSVIPEGEFVADAQKALGEEAIEVIVLQGGHEVAITKGPEVAHAMIGFWNECPPV